MKPDDPTLRSRAYEAIEDLIVTGRLAPGAPVTEGGLAERTGIGRTPIREALQRLAREGLVSIRPRAAIVVLEMTPARQMQLLEARAVLQEQTVRLAARRADVDQRARMLQLAQAVEDAARIGDNELYLRIARDCHHILCEAARNEFLDRFMGSLYALSRQFSFTHLHLLRGANIARGAATHAGILRAVAARNEAEAARASKRMMDFLLEFTASSRDDDGGPSARRPASAASAASAARAARAGKRAAEARPTKAALRHGRR